MISIELLNKIDNYINSNRNDIVKDLRELVEIPSVWDS